MWLLLLAFLPWQLIQSAGEPRQAVEAPSGLPTRGLHPAQIAAVAALVMQQAAASAGRMEIPPLVSAFDMYSSTYASPADYESKAGMSYWLAVSFADGRADSCRVSREDADAAAGGATPRLTRILETCFDTTASAVRAVSVEGSRRAIDWARWRLGDEIRVPLAGPFPIN